MALRQLTDGAQVGLEFFSPVPHSMATLMLYCVFLEDVVDLFRKLGAENPIYAAALLIFIFIATLTVMNMLTGLLVQVVQAVSSVEKEKVLVLLVKQKLQQAMY